MTPADLQHLAANDRRGNPTDPWHDGAGPVTWPDRYPRPRREDRPHGPPTTRNNPGNREGHMMMSARDELADELQQFALTQDRAEDKTWADYADAILAAGYRKPRTITTAEELDALPVGSVISVIDEKCGDSNAWQLFDDVLHLTGEDGTPAKKAWASPAYMRERTAENLIEMGSATVLWEPTP